MGEYHIGIIQGFYSLTLSLKHVGQQKVRRCWGFGASDFGGLGREGLGFFLDWREAGLEFLVWGSGSRRLGRAWGFSELGWQDMGGVSG